MTERTAWYKKEWIVLAGLLGLALALRLVGLGRVPPGVRFDELVNVRMADHIYAGEWPIYFQEAWGHEPLYHYFHALGMSVFGQNVLGVRITSVLFGTLGALTAYLVLRQLYGRGVATIAALLLATSLWSLMYSRVGLRHISLPPWVGLAAYCFWRGLDAPDGRRRHELLWFGLGGVCSGLMLYTYFASRAVPAIFVAFALYLLLFHRQKLRGRWLGVLVFLLLPALIFAPMLLYLRQHPELEQRLGQVGGELFASMRAGDFRPMLDAILDTLKMFSLQGDPEWLYNISGRPVLDPLTSVVFYVGLATSLWRWRDPRRTFLLLWLAAGVAPSLLSWPPGSLGHTIVAQPATLGLVALGLHDVWTWSKRRASSWLRWGGYALAATSLVVFVLLNTYDYFVRWPQYPEVRHEYQAPITAVARYLRAHPGTAPVGVSAPYVDHWNPWSKMNFELYAGDDAGRVRWFDGQQSLVLPESEGALIFLPDHILLPSGLEPELDALVKAGARPLEIGYRDRTGSGFDLYRWTDATPLRERLDAVSSARAWASPETTYVANESEAQRQAIVLPLDFGHQLSLPGYSYGSARVSGGEVWRITTYWKVLDAEGSSRAIFVHVLDEANTVRAGWDGLYVSPEGLQVGDTIIHQHTLTLPPDLPAGEQRVQIGVYSPVTLERLSLFTGKNGETAPYNRALLSPLFVE
jgi:4-amino-4-deoxy-L-arabinose transferase-like glycosyltransferase